MGTMVPSFTGDVALVTGASQGMGRAVAMAFAAAGAQVVLVDIAIEAGNDTAATIVAGGGEATFVATDVTDAAAVQAAVQLAVQRYGRLDCAVNCAAIENEQAPLHECGDDAFDLLQQVNVRGTFLCMKHELREMLTSGRGGAIVNIASTNSFRAQVNQPAYTASKHAVLGLTRSAALDYAGRGVRVNAICPGGIDTPMLRAAMQRRGRDPQEVAGRLSLLGRFGTPDEIAAAALWLCSDASSYVVGQALAVDGGFLIR
jgi:NAD(P)-dependent dehydrogenase (short-subunit alcohol dehydrogenase family)